jgi:hypothetical protein
METVDLLQFGNSIQDFWTKYTVVGELQLGEGLLSLKELSLELREYESLKLTLQTNSETNSESNSETNSETNSAYYKLGGSFYNQRSWDYNNLKYGVTQPCEL